MLGKAAKKDEENEDTVKCNRCQLLLIFNFISYKLFGS